MLLLKISQAEIGFKNIWGQTKLFWAVEGGFVVGSRGDDVYTAPAPSSFPRLHLWSQS